MLIEMLPINKCCSRHSLSSLDLYFYQFDSAPIARTHQYTFFHRNQAARRGDSRLFYDASLPYMQDLAAEKTIRSRPRQKAARTVHDLSRSPVPVDETIFLFQDRR